MDETAPYEADSIEDVDINDPVAVKAWCEKLEDFAEVRIKGAYERLLRLGIIDEHGNLISDELPFDMRPGSDSDVDTG